MPLAHVATRQQASPGAADDMARFATAVRSAALSLDEVVVSVEVHSGVISAAAERGVQHMVS